MSERAFMRKEAVEPEKKYGELPESEKLPNAGDEFIVDKEGIMKDDEEKIGEIKKKLGDTELVSMQDPKIRNVDSEEFKELYKDTIKSIQREKPELQEAVGDLFGEDVKEIVKDWVKSDKHGNYFLEGLAEIQSKGELSAEIARKLEMAISMEKRGSYGNFHSSSSKAQERGLLKKIGDQFECRKYIKALKKLSPEWQKERAELKKTLFEKMLDKFDLY